MQYETYDYVTKAVNNVVFQLTCRDRGYTTMPDAEIVKRGRTSLTIKVDVHIKDTYNTRIQYARENISWSGQIVGMVVQQQKTTYITK